MAPALNLAVGLLGLLVFLLLGMIIELYRDVRQLREAAGIMDRPLEVDLGDLSGAVASSFGLPAYLDAAPAFMVLFLSERCGTCHALAAGFAGRIPAGLQVVLEARDPAAAAYFLERYDLAAETVGKRVLVDSEGRIGERMGLRTTPVGFFVVDGRFVRATTVPSRRYLATILPDRIQLEHSSSRPTRPQGKELEWAG